MKTVFFFVLVAISFLIASFDSSPAAVLANVKEDTNVYGPMKQFWLVFLKKGPNRGGDTATAMRIQRAHIANIERLAAEKVIIMAGPMGYKYDADLRGIFIMDAKDSATAASFVMTDSAIITGRLRFEIHPWWTATGKFEFPYNSKK